MTIVNEQVKKQFEEAPYPEVPFDKSPCQDLNDLYRWSLITPFYRKYQRLINPAGMQVLDVGCGSGVVAHRIVEANPGITLTGIDLSPKSVEVAQSRFAHHGLTGHRFMAMSAEELPQLNQAFDYINCHETLYLLPDPLAGLRAMKAVLKPGGIIRANLHSFHQRQSYFRIQTFFQYLGVTEDCSLQTSIDLVKSFINCLQDYTILKSTWNSSSKTDEYITANMILQGDKGFTIPQMFQLLELAELDYISMVNWQFWELPKLFINPKNIPEEFSLVFEAASEDQLLYMYELLHPVNRLIDFWCGHPATPNQYVPPALLSLTDWHQRTIYVHPVLQDLRFAPKIDFRECLLQALKTNTPLPLNKVFSATSPGEISIPIDYCLCLYHLWGSHLTFTELVDMWAKLRPLDPLTLAPRTLEQVAQELIPILSFLEDRALILIV
jgi:ubiquinone/menaquinone biosynthesis C-methylase UbiE